MFLTFPFIDQAITQPLKASPTAGKFFNVGRLPNQFQMNVCSGDSYFSVLFEVVTRRA